MTTQRLSTRGSSSRALDRFRMRPHLALTWLLLATGLAGAAGSGTPTGCPGDSDGDLLSDADEIPVYRTNPGDADTNGDGTPDGLEVNRTLDPNSTRSRLDRPNIIFIMCDDLGYGDLGVLFQNSIPGTKKLFTPKLDQFAAEGAILGQHYCPAPVCAPSRASFINGLHQGHANVRNNQFDKEIADDHNVANTLRTAGYSTALIGKWGLQGSGSSPASWPAYPTKRGFDYFFGYVRHSDGHNHYPAHSTLGDPSKELYDGNSEISNDLTLCYTADLFTARAKKRIIDETQNNPDQPFFIFLAFDTPHSPLHLPTQAYPAGGGLTGGVQWIGTPGQMINTASGTIDSYVHPDYYGHGWGESAERFATSTRRLDDCVGDLIQTLEDLSIDDDTLVVFTSDNGPHSSASMPGLSYQANEFDSFGPFDGIKRDTWEGGIRMPTLVRWTGGITPGLVSHEASQFHDWMATFTDLAGWTTPARCDGVSLLPTLTGNGEQREGLVYVEYQVSGSTPSYPEFDPSHQGRARGQMQVIWLEGYKGIRVNIQSHDTPFEIFDVNVDPQETIDLAGSSIFFNGLQERMKAKVLGVRQPNTSAARPYDQDLVPSIGAPSGPGLHYGAYEGLWPWVPEFAVLTPVATGIATGPNLVHLSRPDDAGLSFTGYLKVPSSGLWTFKLSCDTGAHLRIHESQVIDDDYHHTGAEVSGTMQLGQGLHPIRLYYRTGSTLPALSLEWAGPGVTEQPIPTTAFFREAIEGDIVWTGTTDNDIFEETNWDLSGSPVAVIDPDVTINGNIVIADSLQPVEIPNLPGYGRFQVGDGYTLSVDNATTISLGDDGIGGYPGTTVGPVVVLTNGGHLDLAFITNSTTLELKALCSATFKGGGNPINGSTVDLTTGTTLVFTNETVADYLAEHLVKTTVNGAPAVVDGNIRVVSDGGAGCMVTVIASPFAAYCFGDPASGTPCPCGNDNDGSVPESGCANGAFTSGAKLTGSGEASLNADTLILATTGMEPLNSSLYFQADHGLSPGLAWGDGLRCAGGQLRRLGVRSADASGSSDTTGYPLPISVKAGNVTAGDTKYYQCWYRNPTLSPCFTDFNASNGLAVNWAP